MGQSTMIGQNGVIYAILDLEIVINALLMLI